MKRITLIPITLICTAAVYVIITLLAAIANWALARADAGATPTDPSALLQKYGWWGGALLAYVAVRWFLKTNESQHWLAHGRTLSIVTAVLSVVGSVIGWRFGMDPDVVGFAVAGAVPLAIPSTVTSSGGAPTGSER